MDPLNCLDDDCVRILLSLLSSVELVRYELVSRSWKSRIRWWMADSGTRLHFPYAWQAQNGKDSNYDQFKRLAYQEDALKHGEPTVVQRFPHAHHFVVAGDFVVWAAVKDDSINWQLLSSARPDKIVGETNTLDLRDVGQWNREIALLAMDLNPDGYLLLRARLGSSIYVPWDSSFSVEYRDVVYSLNERNVIWQMAHVTEAPQFTPLLIGKQRVYFASKTSNNGYDLVAFELHTGRMLYRTLVVPKIADSDHARLAINMRNVLQLIEHCGDEVIIQLNSDRLFSYGFVDPDYIAIIDGMNGRTIQKIAWAGFGRAPMIAKSNSTAIAIASSVSNSDVVTIQIFSQQADKSFIRTSVRMVQVPTGTAYTGSIVVHPFTLQAFTVRAGDSAPKALTLSPSQPNERQILPCLEADEYYRVTASRPLTLPRRGRHGRRKFNVKAQWNHASMVLVNEGRLVFDHTGSRDDAVYLFDFTPKW